MIDELPNCPERPTDSRNSAMSRFWARISLGSALLDFGEQALNNVIERVTGLFPHIELSPGIFSDSNVLVSFASHIRTLSLHQYKQLRTIEHVNSVYRVYHGYYGKLFGVGP